MRLFCYTPCTPIESRPTVSSVLPPFENGFLTWKGAVGYYTDNFNAGNIRIVKSSSGTNLNPIIVPSAAPTPRKKTPRVHTKNRTTAPKKNSKATAQPIASGSRQAAASDGEPVASAKTKVKKGKKRARRVDESDSDDYPPLYADDDEVTPASKKKAVVNVSDFETPSPISKPRKL